MTQEHPIAPPPELFKQWEDDILNERDNVDHVLDCAWRNGFQAGADQELEACCNWVDANFGQEFAQNLRLLHRPEPFSLKEQALDAWSRLKEKVDGDLACVLRALESLPE